MSQSLLQLIMDGVVDRSRTDHTGKPTSLCDLGYCDVGLDDNWQDCGSPLAADGMHYHDAKGNPIVNLKRFPSLKKMTDYAHSLNLTAGFYGNNCICSDRCRNQTECDMQIHADVKAFLNYGFDSWKLDGCGGQEDMKLFDKYLREMAPQKPKLIESCHWGVPEYDPNPNLPPNVGCPFNFYRSSGDIELSYGSVLHNLASVEKYRAMNASVPGCFAYPDMLQVGVRSQIDGRIGLSKQEARTHFGAWCVISSPLIIGFDVNDEEVNHEIWDIISNREAIAVNQAYDGDSGGVYETASTVTTIRDSLDIQTSKGRHLSDKPIGVTSVPSYQYLSKPIGGGRVAVLLLNSLEMETQLTAKFADIPDLSCNGNYSVRNIWTHSSEGTFEESWSTLVKGHDSSFIIVGCSR